MERFQWFINEVLNQFAHIEAMLKTVFSKIPWIGAFAANQSTLILIVFMITLTVFVIRPLVKWSLIVVIFGAVLAGIISYLSGLSFWGILPLTALGASIVMFSNKFTME